MILRTLPLLLVAALLAAVLVAAGKATADEDEYFPPVADAATEKECGACHLAFPPSMLPARSWRAVMAGLDDHFGEVATLDPATASAIEQYLVANAGDTGGARWGRGALRGIAADATPLRITETPTWVREHRHEVPASAWSNPKVGSKANCVACHRAAERGIYED